VVPETVPVLSGGDGLRCHDTPSPSQSEKLGTENPDATERNDARRLDGAFAVDVYPEHVTAYIVGVGQREVR
jgi:hypothetical protein